MSIVSMVHKLINHCIPSFQTIALCLHGVLKHQEYQADDTWIFMKKWNCTNYFLCYHFRAMETAPYGIAKGRCIVGWDSDTWRDFLTRMNKSKDKKPCILLIHLEHFVNWALSYFLAAGNAPSSICISPEWVWELTYSSGSSSRSL